MQTRYFILEVVLMYPSSTIAMFSAYVFIFDPSEIESYCFGSKAQIFTFCKGDIYNIQILFSLYLLNYCQQRGEVRSIRIIPSSQKEIWKPRELDLLKILVKA